MFFKDEFGKAAGKEEIKMDGDSIREKDRFYLAVHTKRNPHKKIFTLAHNLKLFDDLEKCKAAFFKGKAFYNVDGNDKLVIYELSISETELLAVGAFQLKSMGRVYAIPDHTMPASQYPVPSNFNDRKYSIPVISYSYCHIKEVCDNNKPVYFQGSPGGWGYLNVQYENTSFKTVVNSLGEDFPEFHCSIV